MFKYFALVWDASDPTRLEAVRRLTMSLRHGTNEWQCVLDQSGLKVFCAGQRPGSSEVYHLDEGGGVALGAIFERGGDDGGSSRKARFGAPQTRSILRSRGRDLIRSYWGRYVAFLHDLSGGTKWIIRSPTGELDCLKVRAQGVDLYFSCLSTCPLLEVLHFSLNWEFIAANLCTSAYETRHTGINEVTRLMHGECAQYDGARVSLDQYWHPARIAAADPIEDPELAAERLRHTTRQCVHAWASCYTEVWQYLSGGLDSSIVLSCLGSAAVRPEVTCVNLRCSGDSGTDESEFARLAASHCGYALMERVTDAQFALPGRLDIPRTASPPNNIFAFGPDDSLTHLMRAPEASALFSGQGGDQIFYQTGAGFACVDYLRRHGLTLTTLETAMDCARMEGDTIWRVLFGKSWRSPVSLAVERATLRVLITPEVRERIRKQRLFLHPWLDCTDGIPPGKLWQILTLSSAVPHALYVPWGPSRQPENVAPLVSQPLVELCLQIAPYVLIKDGWNRAAARRAFAGYVPDEIVWRRAKVTTYKAAQILLETNLKFVRELLLSGALVRERLLDRVLLDRVLSGSASDIRAHATHILVYVCFEAWLETWERNRRSMAA
jgi:asparagine synthase (glutamine-hydrolysing)